MKKISLFLILITLILITSCTGQTIREVEPVKEGPFLVTNVIDGDTLDYDNNGEITRVRLSGINTPETGECYYQEAKDKLTDLTLNKYIYLETDKSNKGKYGRELRYVYVDENFVNGFLIEYGYAKVYDKYSYDTKYYEQLKEREALAIRDSSGVWSCVDEKASCEFVASQNSDKYHTPTCKYAKKINSENLVCFNSLEEAEESGKEFSGC